MKKLSFMLTVAMMVIATTASAQFANSSKKSNGNTANTENYNRITAAYNSVSVQDLDLMGFSVGWTKGINIANGLPLYLETGIGVMYAFGDYTDWKEDTYEESYLGVNVPLQLTYKFSPIEMMAIAPYAGLNLRGNILGKEKWPDYDETYDWFEEGYDAKRFGVGASLGVNFDFNKFSIGVGYTFDFTEIMEKAKIDYFSVAFGVKF